MEAARDGHRLGDASADADHDRTWTASAVERLAVLLRARDVPSRRSSPTGAGGPSSGRRAAARPAPPCGTPSLFSEEPTSLQALVALLTRVPFPGRAAEGPASRPVRREPSNARKRSPSSLGRQVREAVELLVTTLDQLDRESGGALLAGVSDDDLYAGVVTVMMRVRVPALRRGTPPAAQRRRPLRHRYSVGHLVEQLEQRPPVYGEQTLEHRTAAWHRLLAVTRAVHCGVAHEDLRLPAYGGGLFDPDRYPWLEGRAAGTARRSGPPARRGRPHRAARCSRAVQYVRIGGERRRLTFRALDVEQIGYVYEGLLELEVRTATETVLGLGPPDEVAAARSRKTLRSTLAERRRPDGRGCTDRTGRSANKVAGRARQPAAMPSGVSAPPRRRAPTPRPGSSDRAARPRCCCDELGLPAHHPAGRPVRHLRSTAAPPPAPTTRPRSLAEEVAEAPSSPSSTAPDRWKPSTVAVAAPPVYAAPDLKVADIAMGSGAFLVAACRYLADRLVEAWRRRGRRRGARHATAPHRRRVGADAEADPLLLTRPPPRRRALPVRRRHQPARSRDGEALAVADHHGPPNAPSASSTTASSAGDSLLGLVSLEQLESLHVDAKEGRRLHHGTLDFASEWRDKLAQAADLRRKITATGGVTIRDIEHKARLLAEAEELSGDITWSPTQSRPPASRTRN